MAPRALLAVGLVVLAAVLAPAAATTVLSDQEMAEVVNAHNKFRRNVQPTAKNMAKMVWDKELATLARFWAVNCEMEPNEFRHEQSSEFDYVGENLAATRKLYSYNLTDLVSKWHSKGLNYDYYSLTCEEPEEEDERRKRADDDDEEDECRPYTQIVWAETYKIGCGRYKCDELRGWDDEDEEDNDNNNNNDDDTALLFVCYYGPGGSYQGERPYTSGEKCSGCPSSQPLCENGLCTAGEETDAAQTLASPISMATILLILSAVATLA